MNQDHHIVCPLCGDGVDKLIYRYHIDNEKYVLQKIKDNNPEWSEHDGACGRCVDYYHTEVVMQQRILPEVGPHFPVRSADDFVILPVPLRLDADARFTGKGVTICFIDSGFNPHPDLTAYKNRIKTIVDIPNIDETSKAPPLEGFGDAAWHGTMTSVVCAGDGYSSGGLYRGIASNAELVLLKVMNDARRITTGNIVKALEWVLKNYRKYNIRIVNMSLGDDAALSYKQSEVDRLAEQLVEKGIVVVAAVGNDENGTIKPPANSPHVIAVGGLDDENSLNELPRLYHSSYGKSEDELTKPELVANAIWIAAPILPGTKEQREATALYGLVSRTDDDLAVAARQRMADVQLGTSVLQSNDAIFIREEIIRRIQTCKYISPHYMHVDGTSFAAPIISSVIAQLLEINPELTPSGVKEIIFSTASRLQDWPPERQGFGIVQPRKAVLKTLKRQVILKPNLSPHVNRQKNTIGFYVQHDCASQISVAGSFNSWAPGVLLMEAVNNGLWQFEIPMLPAGRYQYKFFVDEKNWIEDVDNPYREPDGFNGFNSILMIDN